MTILMLCGDNHLGKGQDLGRAPGERLAEQESVWRQTLALSRDRGCDAVIHCGDLFDGRRPGPDVMLAAERPLVEHQEHYGAPVYMVAGNHDVPSQDGPCGLDVLAEAGLVELAREPRVWDTGVGHVCALPWTPVSRLIAAFGGATDRAEVNAHAADMLLQTAADLRRTAAGPAILVGHWSVTGTVLPNGIDVGSLGGVVLPLDDLQSIGYDLIAFGHIHAHQVRDRFLYVGSPQQLDFGDSGAARGVWLWDDDGDIEFVSIDSRRFVTVGISENDPLDGIAGAFVKVRGTLTEDEYRRFNHNAARAELEAAGAYSVTFDVTVERARRDRGAVLDDAMTPADQLAAYLAAQGINGTKGAAMLERAGRYLEGAAS